jgi:hypothetical protein
VTGALFALGFRPLYLLAGGYAALSVAVWAMPSRSLRVPQLPELIKRLPQAEIIVCDQDFAHLPSSSRRACARSGDLIYFFSVLCSITECKPLFSKPSFRLRTLLRRASSRISLRPGSRCRAR